METVHEKQMLLFLINPKSGVSEKKRIPQMVERYVDHNRYDVVVSYTKYAGHAYELAKDAAERGVYAVIAVGGDGTVNEVGRALVHTNTALGVIPCGSGNGFARHLGIPVEVRKSIDFINTAEPVNIDYGKINGHSFFCSCGVGFDALVSCDFAKSKGRGILNYIKTSLVNWAVYKPETYLVETDSFKKTFKAFVIACGNASQYGNNAYITPSASMRDGMLTVSVLAPFNAFEAPLIATQLFTHMLDESNHITTLTIPWMRIVRENAGPVHFDGEPYVLDRELFVEMIPGGIKVLSSPGWDGTCAPVPLYRQFYEMFDASLVEMRKIGVAKK